MPYVAHVRVSRGHRLGGRGAAPWSLLAAWRARRAVFEEALRAAHGEARQAEVAALVASLDAALAGERLEDVARAAEALTAHLAAFPQARGVLFEETAATVLLA